MKINRRRALAAGGAILSTLALPAGLRAQGKPIRIGSTLPLTGPLASLAIIHKVTAEMCVENLNKRGGLLGRPVEWVLRDDQSWISDTFAGRFRAQVPDKFGGRDIGLFAEHGSHSPIAELWLPAPVSLGDPVGEQQQPVTGVELEWMDSVVRRAHEPEG